jgi:hypothetical protein
MLRLICVVAAVACSGTAAPPAEPPRAAGSPSPSAHPADAGRDATALDQDLPALAARSVTMYQDIARAFAASGEDCAAAAARLRQLAIGYHDVVAANARILHDGRARELRAALEPHGDVFDASARDIVSSPTMARCSQDPAFARAFDELLEPPP